MTNQIVDNLTAFFLVYREFKVAYRWLRFKRSPKRLRPDWGGKRKLARKAAAKDSTLEHLLIPELPKDWSVIDHTLSNGLVVKALMHKSYRKGNRDGGCFWWVIELTNGARRTIRVLTGTETCEQRDALYAAVCPDPKDTPWTMGQVPWLGATTDAMALKGAIVDQHTRF